MARWKTLLMAGAVAIGARVETSRAVVFASTGEANFNTTAPTGQYAGSGWQFQGRTENNFLGTPIAPQYFITAEHIGPNDPVMSFFYDGQTYTTDAFFDDPNSDLRIWHITGTFDTYAPLYTGNAEVNQELVVFGRGPERGVEIPGNGWLWGTMNTFQRWGTNQVSAIANGGQFGSLLQATFDFNGPATEAMLTVRDSGGGVFIKDTDGVWKLAGINLSVSGPYKENAESSAFNAALYDQTGYLAQQDNGSFAPATGPGSFYATRISSNIAFIQQIAGVPEPSAGLLGLCGLATMLATTRRRSSK